MDERRVFDWKKFLENFILKSSAESVGLTFLIFKFLFGLAVT